MLADTLTGEAWKQPEVPPETTKLRTAKIEIERCLAPASGKHVTLCVAKLAVLPTKDGSPVDKALYTDNFIDACGEFPPDIWTTTCIELLKSKTFRPSPAEFIAIAQKQLNRRQDMLFRVKQMLTFTPALKAGFVKEPLEVRLRAIRDAWKRIGNLARSDIAETELALLEGRQPILACAKLHTEYPQPVGEAAKLVELVDAEVVGLRKIGDAVAGLTNEMQKSYKAQGDTLQGLADQVMSGSLDATSPESQARLKMALARQHRKDGRIGYAKTLEAAALKLWPALAEPPQREARHG